MSSIDSIDMEIDGLFSGDGDSYGHDKAFFTGEI
jgi:hypothetical protein